MAQVRFIAQASTKELRKVDYVEVQFIIENASQIGALQPPDLNDFNIIQGPNQSTGMSMMNGVTTQYKGISYLLQPKKTGMFLIKPATAVVDGNQMRTNTLQIVVRDQAAPGNQPPAFAPSPDPAWPAAQPAVDMDELIRPGDNVAERIRKNFFIKVEVSKTDCYVGEPIVATYKLYARLRSDSRVTRHPSLNGFSVYDMVDPSEDRVSVEKLNGKNYSVHIIRKTQLIPLQAGDITLDPVELDNNIYFIKADASTTKTQSQGLGGLLDRLFEPEVNGTPFTQHITLESKPVTIHVKPLPEEGKPAGYNGAVGNYTIQASLDTKEVDTGDAAKLTVTVKGAGNLPVINAPSIDWPRDMESYDMSSKENIVKTAIPLGGSKQFTYSFICNKTGDYVVPPVAMSFFNPATKTYKTVRSDSLLIHVNKSLVKKHITPAKPILKSDNVEWRKYALWGAVFILLAASMIYIVRQSKKDAQLKAERAKAWEALEQEKKKPAPVDPLMESRLLMQSEDFSKFYASVNRAIWKSVSDKLQLPASELNKLNIASGLRAKAWTDDEIIELKNILNECEMKLYTPEYSTTDMHRMLASAEGIIARLQV